MNKYFLTFLSVLTVSCNNPINVKEYNANGYAVQTSSINGRITGVYTSMAKELGIYPIDKGYDSMQIRIWFIKEDFEGESYLLLLRHYKLSGWKTVLVKFNGSYDRALLRIKKQSVKSVAVNNVKKIKNIVNLLSFDSVYQKRYWSCGPNIPIGYHYIVIECATTKYYNIFQFVAPADLVKSCEYSAQLNSYLKQLQQTFDLPFISEYIQH